MKGSDESSDKHEEKIVPEISCPAVKAGSGWVQCLITYHQTAFLLKCFTAGWSTPGAPSLRGQRMTRRWLSRCGNWLIFSSLSLTFLDVNKNLNPGKGSHHRIPATKVSSLFLPCSGPQQWPRHITRRLWRWVHYWIKQQIHFDLQAKHNTTHTARCQICYTVYIYIRYLTMHIKTHQNWLSEHL